MSVRIILFLSAVVFFLVLGSCVAASGEGNATTTSVNTSSGIMVYSGSPMQNDNDSVKIYVNDKTGAVHRVFGNETKIREFKRIRSSVSIKEKNSSKTIISAVEFTDNFISGNRNFLRVNPDDLKLEGIDSDDANYYINYRQYYHGIPVYQSFVGLTVDFEGRVLLMGSGFHPDVNVSVIPQVHKKELVEFLNNYAPGIEILNFSLVIFPEEKDDNFIYHLAWMVSSSGNGSRVFFVDAHTGELIYYYDAIRNLNGTVTGMIYPEHPLQNQVEASFPHEFVYVNETRNDSSVFYSNSGNNLNNYMVTKVKINLTNISSANLSFVTRYDIEQGWDFAYVEVSKNGTVWEQLNSSGMSTYANPEAYAAGWIPGAPAYTGNSIVWINETIMLDEYINNSVFLRFRYTTDAALIKEGIYFDDVKVTGDTGVIFSDGAENGSSKWNFHGFLIKSSSTVISALTEVNGSYEFNDLDLSGDARNLTLTSGLSGLWVSVENEDANEALHNFTVNLNGTHDWNWNESDTSDRNEESNVYYHVNKIHDFFKKFNFEGMDYQIKVTVESGTNWCNAEYDPMNEKINLGGGNGGNCKNLALGSDVIYHEYTHGVVDHIFDYGGSTKCNLPIEAMDEDFADYFATTINNNSLIAENILPTADVRNINNTLTLDDIVGECHKDGRILSGALWNLRADLGAGFTDALVFKAIRITPHAMNFSEFLENLLVADDDNANLWDGTPDKNEICGEFSARKIYSFWCADMRPDFTVEDLTFSPEDLTNSSFITVNATIKNTGNINLTLSNVNVSLFIDNLYKESKILNLTNITEKEVNFNWSAISGKHSITIKIDSGDLINESDKDNNELTEVIGVDCIIPVNQFYVNKNTLFCKGIYNGVQVIINISDVVLDCNGATLNGAGLVYGIYLKNKNNVTIKNCNVMNYDKGIGLYSSSNNTIINNSVNSNSYAGIWLYISSNNNAMINNTVSSNNGRGIDLYLSSDNTINNNTINSNNDSGIWLFAASNNILQGNVISNNSIGVYSRVSSSTINSNFVCKNNLLDFNSSNWQSSYGANNTCDNANGWDDDGIDGCWYTCSGLARICDLNHDEIIINDWNDLMTAYKCFMGIEKNCRISYQDWNLIKQEYECFIGKY